MSEESKYVVEHLPVKSISYDKRCALRPAQTESAEFTALKDSIESRGLDQPISVRPDPLKPGHYLLVDGTQRFTAVSLLEHDTVPCFVAKSMSDIESMRAQIHANCQRVLTRPAQVGRLILQMIVSDPTGKLTLPDVAKQLSQTAEWVGQRVQLQKLNPAIQELVNAGVISVAKGVMIAKLPSEEQDVYAAKAQSGMAPQDFMQDVAGRIKQVKEAEKAGKAVAAPVFEPASKLRSKTEIEDEHASNAVRTKLIGKSTTGAEGWTAAIKWVLSLDAETVAAAKAKWDIALAEKAKRDAAKAEKAAAAEAAAAAATAGL
jgi:ParB/RepB/Spo0J family partition protein